jgi:hypothetical protein
MQLGHPHRPGEWLEARLLSLALREAGKSTA